MALADELEAQAVRFRRRSTQSRARVLTLDIETQRAIVEVWRIFKPFVHIDDVIEDARVLCFAAKWRGSDKIIFKQCWKDHDEQAYLDMLKVVWDLLSEADILVTWNGDRFDWQWLEREFTRLGMQRPLPYKSIDLIKIQKKWFKAGQLSLKLDWSARMFLKDKKIEHGGTDLWRDIRYGTKLERGAAQKLMREYNIHDVELTANLFEVLLPYAPVNMALFESIGDDGLLHCTKCNSTNMERAQKDWTTKAFRYSLFRCNDCGAPSHGKRSRITTELRPA